MARYVYPDVDEALVSATECARRRGVTPGAITAAIRRGQLHARKVGVTWALTEAECESYTAASASQRGKLGGRGRTRAKRAEG